MGETGAGADLDIIMMHTVAFVRNKAEWLGDSGAVWSAATGEGPVGSPAPPGSGRFPPGVRLQPLSRRPTKT